MFKKSLTENEASIILYLNYVNIYALFLTSPPKSTGLFTFQEV